MMTESSHLTHALMRTDLPLSGGHAGKVRDVYPCVTQSGEEALLIVATDRISAFDVVMASAPPGKGVVLTQLSTFWFEKIRAAFDQRLDDHLISTNPADVRGLSDDDIHALQGRVMIGRRCEVIPIECVARGYLAGSGWREYQKHQSVCGIELPPGLRQCEKLDQPIFTPATKAAEGHDENITFDQACEMVGEDLMIQLREWTLSIYQYAHDYAARRGIILADTKFEFGIPIQTNKTVETKNKTPILIDEVLTPDSSRFWPSDAYEVGRDQSSFDKQYVRNHLQQLVDQGQWKKQPPGPQLPDDVLANTMDKYREAYRRLTGEALQPINPQTQ